MPSLSVSDFPAEGYALHVDVALGPHGPVKDAVVVVEGGRITELCETAAYQSRPNARKPKRLPGTAIMPGILDVHHHIVEHSACRFDRRL